MPFLPVSLKVYQKVPFTSKCPSRHASILLFPFHLRPPPAPPRSPIVLAAPGAGRARCQRERNRRERKELETKREAGIAAGPAPAGAVTPSPPACCLAAAPGDGAGRVPSAGPGTRCPSLRCRPGLCSGSGGHRRFQRASTKAPSKGCRSHHATLPSRPSSTAHPAPSTEDTGGTGKPRHRALGLS